LISTNLTKTSQKRGWTQVLRNEKQFLIHIGINWTRIKIFKALYVLLNRVDFCLPFSRCNSHVDDRTTTDFERTFFYSTFDICDTFLSKACRKVKIKWKIVSSDCTFRPLWHVNLKFALEYIFSLPVVTLYCVQCCCGGISVLGI